MKFSGNERTVIDGLVAGTQELVAGFGILQVTWEKEATEWVRRTPNVAPHGEAEVEVRGLMDVEESGYGFTPCPEVAKLKFR